MSSAAAFPPTANPAGYVASAGSERALAALERWALASPRPVCVLRGPPGMGKTLLLKLFAARARDRFETAFVPHPDCNPKALCRAVLGALGAEPTGDLRAGLLRALRARRPDGAALLIAIDEADYLPPETATWLVDLVGASGGALRALLALTDGAERAELEEALGGKGDTVTLDAAMSRRELEAYVHAELERAGVDRSICARFDPTALAELHARSGGVPGALRREAARIVFRAELARGAPAAPRAPARETAGARPVEIEPRREVRSTPEDAAGQAAGVRRRRGPLAVAVLCAAAGFALASGVAAWRGELVADRFEGAGERLAPTARPAEPALSAPRASPDSVDVAAAPPPSAAVARIPAPEAPAPPPAAAPPAAPVFVSVNADPWAEIGLDGEPVGETPIARLAVQPGRHRFSARMPDGRVLAREVHVPASGARVVFP